MDANLIQLLLKASDNKAVMDIKLTSGDLVTGVISFAKKQIDVNGELYSINDILEIKAHEDNPLVARLEELQSERVFIRLVNGDIISGFLMNTDGETIDLITSDNRLSFEIDQIKEVSDEEILDDNHYGDGEVEYEIVDSKELFKKYPYGGFESDLCLQKTIPLDIKEACLSKFAAHEYSEALKVLSECPINESNKSVLEELLDYLEGVVDRYEDKGQTYKEEYGYCYQGGLAGVVEQNAEKAVALYMKEIDPWGEYSALALCCSLNTVLRIGSKDFMHKTAISLEKYINKIEAISGIYSQAQAYKTILTIFSRVEAWDDFNDALCSMTKILSEEGHAIAANNARFKNARILIENSQYEYAEKQYRKMIESGDTERALLMLVYCLDSRYGIGEFKNYINEYIINNSEKHIWNSIEAKYIEQYENSTTKLEYLDSIISTLDSEKEVQEKSNTGKKEATNEDKTIGVDLDTMVADVIYDDIEDEWEDVFSGYRKNGQIPAARNYFKKKMSQYPNNDCLKLINRRIEIWQAQFGSYKSIGTPSTNYERGMYKWFKERNNNEASALFITSIKSHDADKATALYVFLDFSAVEYGFDQALGSLPFLRPLVKDMDKRMKVTFYEKVYSFAFLQKDNGEALSALNSLQNLYFSKNQLGKTEYRIAGIYYLQGKWAKAKEHLEKTLQYSYNVENANRMIENCENCLAGSKVKGFVFEGESVTKVDITRIKAELQYYYNNIQYEEAKKYIKSIYVSNSDNEEIVRIKENVERIVDNLNNYSSGFPKKSDNASRAWRAWHIEEDYTKAEKYYRKEMSEKGAKFLPCLFDLSEMLMHVKGNALGVACLKEKEEYIQSLDNLRQASYYEKMNTMLQKTDDYEEKYDCLQHLLRIYITHKNNEKIAYTYYRLGVVAFGHKDYSNVIQYMNKAIENRYNATAICYQYIVTAYVKAGKEAEALELSTNILKKEGTLQDNNLSAFLQQTIEKIKLVKSGDAQDHLSHEEEDEEVFDLLFEPNDKLIMYLLNNQLVRQQIDMDKGETQQKLEKYGKRTADLKGIDLANNIHKLAILENELNGQTQFFYTQMKGCVNLYARNAYANRNYDSAVLWNIYMLSNTRNLEKNIEYTHEILKCALKEFIKGEVEVKELISRIFESDNENAEYAFRLLVFTISKSSYLHDSHSGELKKIIELPENKMFAEQLTRFIDIPNRDKLDFSTMIKNIQNRVSADTNHTHILINKFRNSKSFNEEYVEELRKLRDMVFVLKEDVNFINDFVDIYEKALEIYEYPDYDNKIATIRTVQDRIIALNNRIDDKPTYFAIYYLCDFMDAMLGLLSIVSDTTAQELAPELYITVPITEVENVDNQNMISITVTNKENAAIATSLFVSLFDSEGNSLLENGNVELAPYLKGGASKSIELDIPTQTSDTYSIRIQVQYKNHKDEICMCAQDESISTVSTTYEEINGNPYVDGKALDPQKNKNVFMGRDDLLSELETSLVDDSGQCVIIYGQKRCGKTSISNFLQERIRDKFVIISFSAGSAMSASQLYNNVRTKFMLELMKMIHSKETIIPEDEKEQLKLLHSDLAKMDVSNGEAFIDMMRIIYGQYCLMKEQELLIIIDEFTHLYRLYQKGDTERSEVTAFMDTWKKGSEEKLFKSLLIGQDTMPYIMAAYPNQLAITDPRRVDRLDDDSVRQLIEKPILLSDGSSRYMEKSIELIANWFYGQPYYISVYCKRMVEHMKASHKNYVTNAMAEKVKNEMLLSSTISFFDNLINAGDIDMTSETDLRNLPTYKLLCSIAYLTKNSEWANIDDIDIPDKDKLIEDLINRSVIDRRKSRCRIYINFFKEWLNIYGRE